MPAEPLCFHWVWGSFKNSLNFTNKIGVIFKTFNVLTSNSGMYR